MQPLIIAFYDGAEEVQILSNFALTPFTLDGRSFKCVEGFWQGLKVEEPELRDKFQYFEGFDAKQGGKMVKTSRNMFTYEGKLYTVGSEAHHVLLERALRAKTAQNPLVQRALWDSGVRPLKHMLKNKYNQWRPGDSPALPAVAFERMWERIRSELRNNTFTPTLPLPNGLNDFVDSTYE